MNVQDPKCDCHDTVMMWHKDSRRESGGYWRCRVKHNANSRKWMDENRDYYREYTRAYQTARNEEWPEHVVYDGMIQRCENPNNKFYHLYGGAGVTVCDRWRESFWNFIEDVGRRPEGKHPSGKSIYSMGRIGDEGDYSPENAYWMSSTEQGEHQAMKRAKLKGIKEGWLKAA